MEKDREILRPLAEEVARIAALPVQEETKRLWRALVSLKPERPMVKIDQICWNEFAEEDELALHCEDKECRAFEWELRSTLYRWKYFPTDMVVEPYFEIERAIHNTMFGMEIEEETLATDATNEIISHHYENQFNTIEDVETKIKTPVVTEDKTETKRRVENADYLFGDILPIRAEGWCPYMTAWDNIAMWMGVEPALIAMIDDPDMIHALMKKMAGGFNAMLDQMEAQGLICAPQDWIHCTGAFTDELPVEGYDPAKPRAKDVWAAGLAQMLGSVSPAMYKEFEIDYMAPVLGRCGLVYYGCCDPLDNRIDILRAIPHLRKISMSPWANKERGAMNIHGDFVFSNKPNPAFLAGSTFHEEIVRKDLEETKAVCEKYGCPLEFILKDISTIHHEPVRLKEWADIAMQVAMS